MGVVYITISSASAMEPSPKSVSLSQMLKQSLPAAVNEVYVICMCFVSVCAQLIANDHPRVLGIRDTESVEVSVL